jgi:predicted S18 family serine protease
MDAEMRAAEIHRRLQEAEKLLTDMKWFTFTGKPLSKEVISKTQVRQEAVNQLKEELRNAIASVEAASEEALRQAAAEAAAAAQADTVCQLKTELVQTKKLVKELTAELVKTREDLRAYIEDFYGLKRSCCCHAAKYFSPPSRLL